MHKLIEYPESNAQLLLHLIDVLIQLLSQGESRDLVSLDDVRQMLTRRWLPEGQRELYQALCTAGDKSLSGSELAQQLGKTPQQLAGVLGALGRRINNSEGLADKGGITVILDITQGRNGEWHYCMRPILREALKAEGII